MAFRRFRFSGEYEPGLFVLWALAALVAVSCGSHSQVYGSPPGGPASAVKPKPAPPAGQPGAQDPDVLYDTMADADCGTTDAAPFTLASEAFVGSVEVKYSWEEGETEAEYSIYLKGEPVGHGFFSRGGPSRVAGWETVSARVDATMPRGDYLLETFFPRLCKPVPDGSGAIRVRRAKAGGAAPKETSPNQSGGEVRARETAVASAQPPTPAAPGQKPATQPAPPISFPEDYRFVSIRFSGVHHFAGLNTVMKTVISIGNGPSNAVCPAGPPTPLTWTGKLFRAERRCDGAEGSFSVAVVGEISPDLRRLMSVRGEYSARARNGARVKATMECADVPAAPPSGPTGEARGQVSFLAKGADARRSLRRMVKENTDFKGVTTTYLSTEWTGTDLEPEISVVFSTKF